MPLFIPRLSATARPPIGFPPRWRPGFDAVWALIFLLVGFVPRSLAPYDPPLFAASVACLGYAYISSALQRDRWWRSRYETVFQLLILLSIVSCFSLLFGSGGCVAYDQRGGGALWPGPSWSFLLGVYGALHLVFADGSAFLQAWGCKWSDARRWASCSAAELALAFVALAGAALTLAISAAALLADPARAAAAAAVSGGLAAAAAIAAWLWREDYALHLHHYYVALLLLPLAAAAARHGAALPHLLEGDRSWSPAHGLSLPHLLEGALFGMLIEGIATWGAYPLLVARRAPRGGAVDHTTVAWVAAVSALSSPIAAAAVASAFARLRALLAEGLSRLDAEEAAETRRRSASLSDAERRRASPPEVSGSRGEVGVCAAMLREMAPRRLSATDDRVTASVEPAELRRWASPRRRSAPSSSPATVGAQSPPPRDALPPLVLDASALAALLDAELARSSPRSEQCAERRSAWRAALATLLAQLEAALSTEPLSRAASAAFFALADVVEGAALAGSLELWQAHRLHAGAEVAGEPGTAAAAALAIAAGYPAGRDLSSDAARERFNSEHLRWRLARDSWGSVLGSDGAWQARIAATIDEASQLC